MGTNFFLDRFLDMFPDVKCCFCSEKTGCVILSVLSVFLGTCEMFIEILRHEIPKDLIKNNILIGYVYPHFVYFFFTFIVTVNWILVSIISFFTLVNVQNPPKVNLLGLWVIGNIIVMVLCLIDMIFTGVYFEYENNHVAFVFGMIWSLFKAVFCFYAMMIAITLCNSLILMEEQAHEKTKSELEDKEDNIELGGRFIHIPLNPSKDPSIVFKTVKYKTDDKLETVREIILDSIELSVKRGIQPGTSNMNKKHNNVAEMQQIKENKSVNPTQGKSYISKFCSWL